MPDLHSAINIYWRRWNGRWRYLPVFTDGKLSEMVWCISIIAKEPANWETYLALGVFSSCSSLIFCRSCTRINRIKIMWRKVLCFSSANSPVSAYLSIYIFRLMSYFLLLWFLSVTTNWSVCFRMKCAQKLNINQQEYEYNLLGLQKQSLFSSVEWVEKI